jgi:potassium-transporting ATPase KdpC subunit
MQEFFKVLKPAVLLFVAFSVLLGLVYPLLITGIVQISMLDKADGSLVVVQGKIVGSELISQNFTRPGYFHGRPSAVGYAGDNSGASNLGPTSAKLLNQTRLRVEGVRKENDLLSNASVPADLALASASGLDPHISVESAMLQVSRVAKARGLAKSEVQVLVYQYIEHPMFGILGQERVNVLRLNLALDNFEQERMK